MDISQLKNALDQKLLESCLSVQDIDDSTVEIIVIKDPPPEVKPEITRNDFIDHPVVDSPRAQTPVSTQPPSKAPTPAPTLPETPTRVKSPESTQAPSELQHEIPMKPPNGITKSNTYEDERPISTPKKGFYGGDTIEFSEEVAERSLESVPTPETLPPNALVEVGDAVSVYGEAIVSYLLSKKYASLEYGLTQLEAKFMSEIARLKLKDESITTEGVSAVCLNP
jgi:hypothetical protein